MYICSPAMPPVGRVIYICIYILYIYMFIYMYITYTNLYICVYIYYIYLFMLTSHATGRAGPKVVRVPQKVFRVSKVYIYIYIHVYAHQPCHR